MKIKAESKNPRARQDKRTRNILISIVTVAVVLFAVAGLGVANEINSLYSQLDEQRALLNESLDKTVSSYMETKYFGTTHDNGSVEGAIDLSTLSEAEIQQLLDTVMGSVNEYLTDDVYKGLSELAVDDLRSSIAQSVQNTLLDMGVSSASISDEVTALVLKTIENNLNEYKNSLAEATNNITNVSNTVANTETKVTNLDASVKNLSKGYDSAIASLKTTDATLAARIDTILKNGATSSEEFERQIASLVTELKNQKQTMNDMNSTTNNNYNALLQQIENSNQSNTTTAENLTNQINNLQNTLTQYINNGAIAGSITPRTDGGSGNQLTLVIPDSN